MPCHAPLPCHTPVATPPFTPPDIFDDLAVHCHTPLAMPRPPPHSPFPFQCRVSGSNILEYFAAHDNLTEAMATGCLAQLLQALVYLHQRSIAHFSIRVSGWWMLSLVERLSLFQRSAQTKLSNTLPIQKQQLILSLRRKTAFRCTRERRRAIGRRVHQPRNRERLSTSPMDERFLSTQTHAQNKSLTKFLSREGSQT